MQYFKKYLFVIVLILSLVIVGNCKDDSKTLKRQDEIKNEKEKKVKNDIQRNKIAKELTKVAKKVKTKLTFKVDPNDDTTLMIFRVTSLRPKQIENWESYLYSVGTNIDELKKQGFNKVRIYTTKSKDISDYALKLLL